MRAAEQRRVLLRAAEAGTFQELSDVFVVRAIVRPSGKHIVAPAAAKAAFEAVSDFLGEPVKDGAIGQNEAWSCPTYGLANCWVRLLAANRGLERERAS